MGRIISPCANIFALRGEVNLLSGCGRQSLCLWVLGENPSRRFLAVRSAAIRRIELGRSVHTGTSADILQLQSLLRRIEAAENAGDAGELANMLAEDAVLMVPDQPVQEGKAACVSFATDVMTGLLTQFERRIVYVSSEVRALGDYGFDRGSFSVTLTPKSGGKISRETGKYFFLYSRAPGSSWKIARAIVNLNAHETDQHDHQSVGA